MFRHKTFVEARSIAAPFVSFWRVYAFHAVLLTVMASLVRGYHWDISLQMGCASRTIWLVLAGALHCGPAD